LEIKVQLQRLLIIAWKFFRLIAENFFIVLLPELHDEHHKVILYLSHICKRDLQAPDVIERLVRVIQSCKFQNHGVGIYIKPEKVSERVCDEKPGKYLNLLAQISQV